MARRRWRAAFGTALAGALLPIGVAAQQSNLVPDLGAPSAAGPKFNVAIVNEAEQVVRFSLRPAGGSWTEYVLARNEKQAYSCFGCGGTFEISVNTAGLNTADTVVSYNLTTGSLYGIRFDPDRRIYDVFKLE